MEGNGIENLFFNLASESRLDILRVLSVESFRMNEIARKINITATEASRQTQRLVDERIIQKHPDASYTLTNYGKLVLHFFPTLEFIFKHKKYFLAHDIWQLPHEFISRLGELAQGTLCTEIAGTVDGIENMMKSANEHVWVITDQVMSVHNAVMVERISKGVKFRSLIHERLAKASQVKLSGKNVERQIMASIPGLAVITEKEAFFALLTMEGQLTHSGFFGTDNAVIKWVTDLFLYYWNQNKE